MQKQVLIISNSQHFVPLLAGTVATLTPFVVRIQKGTPKSTITAWLIRLNFLCQNPTDFVAGPGLCADDNKVTKIAEIYNPSTVVIKVSKIMPAHHMPK